MLKPTQNPNELPDVEPLVARYGDTTVTPEQLRAHKTEWLLRAGYSILGDSDVIDMGDYVVPKEVVGGTTYQLNTGNLEYLVATYSVENAIGHRVDDNLFRNKTVYVGVKPLRVTGIFAYESCGLQSLLVLRVSRGEQVHMHLSRSWINEPMVTVDSAVVTMPSGLTQIERSSLTPAERRSIAKGTRSSLSYALREKYATLLDNLSAINRTSQYAMMSNLVVYRDNHLIKWGSRISPDHLRTVKERVTKPMGEFLKRSINCDLTFDELVSEVVDLFDTSRLPVDATRYLVKVWNDNCSSGDELTYGECGHVFQQDDGHVVRGGDQAVCPDCFEEDYVWVEDRDEYWHREDCYYHSDDCYYSYPEDDDADDDDDSSCLSSWGASTEYLAHDKSFTPSPSGDFTMGIELEVEATECRKDRVSECDRYFNPQSRYAMFKSDGSLDSQLGFEIVTAARRLGDHIKMFKDWGPEELTSWDAGNCGMHVHIDSRAFTPLTLGKFLMFFNSPDNAEFIRDIAGRHPKFDGQARSYAATIDKRYVSNPDIVKKSSYDNESRYRMVNVTNLTDYEQDRLGMRVSRQSKGHYSTIEVRIFRGTLRKDRLLAQIEFAHAAVAFCRVASWQDMGADEFKHWLSVTEGYPNLRRWYGVSRARNKNNTEAACVAEVEEI